VEMTHELQRWEPSFHCPVGNYFGILQDTEPGPINFIDVACVLKRHFHMVCRY
jgi:hypothetical protein